MEIKVVEAFKSGNSVYAMCIAFDMTPRQVENIVRNNKECIDIHNALIERRRLDKDWEW